MEYYAVLILYYIMMKVRNVVHRVAVYISLNLTNEDPPTPPRSSSLAGEGPADEPAPEDDIQYGQKKLGPSSSRDAHLTRSQDSVRQQIELVSLFSIHSVFI